MAIGMIILVRAEKRVQPSTIADSSISLGMALKKLVIIQVEKGVSFMENTSEWHGKVPSDSEMEIAVKEISAHIKEE